MSDNLVENNTGPTEVEEPEIPAEEPPEEDIADSSPDDAPSELSLDVTFDILRNSRRQRVLEYLRDGDEVVTIGELAEHIAAIENDSTIKQLDAQQRKRVYIGLYQSHLPKMSDVGVIEFNQSRGRVSPGEHIEPLFQYLDVANGRTNPHSNDSTGDSDSESETDTGTGESGEAEFNLSTGMYGATLGVFGISFFVAQFSGAHLIATLAVVLLIVGTVVAALR